MGVDDRGQTSRVDYFPALAFELSLAIILNTTLDKAHKSYLGRGSDAWPRFRSRSPTAR
jgi:hypothetical protein